jgi:hypothetical protein
MRLGYTKDVLCLLLKHLQPHGTAHHSPLPEKLSLEDDARVVVDDVWGFAIVVGGVWLLCRAIALEVTTRHSM